MKGKLLVSKRLREHVIQISMIQLATYENDFIGTKRSVRANEYSAFDFECTSGDVPEYEYTKRLSWYGFPCFAA